MAKRLSIGLRTDLFWAPLLYSGGALSCGADDYVEVHAMGKYGTGVGMTDVAAMMKAVEAMHTCHVVFHVRTDGKDVSGRMRIELEAQFEVLPGSDLPKVVGVQHSWPSKAASTFDGLLYNLLWQLDFAIQQAYEQMPLIEK